MGRKPVLGLVGACLASVALVGCDNPSQLQGGSKKDVTAASNNSNTSAWNTQRQGQTASGNGTNFSNTTTTGSGGASGAGPAIGTPPVRNDALASGNGTGSGSFNVNPRGPVGDYPGGRSMDPPAASGTGGVERVGNSGTPGPDLTTGHTTLSPATTTNNVGDPSATGLPPLRGGQPAPVPLSTLPPMVTGGTAQPRVQDFPAPSTSRGPVVVPPATGGAPAGGPDLSGNIPPAMPVPSDSGATGNLPPIPAPPAPPVSPATEAMQKPPLPAVSTPRNVMGVPTPSGTNQANFQGGSPQQ
jgi:hypothetical protein